jgi:hypothetical protein
MKLRKFANNIFKPALKFLTIFTGDENGALIYSHYQNSKTV